MIWLSSVSTQPLLSPDLHPVVITQRSHGTVTSYTTSVRIVSKYTPSVYLYTIMPEQQGPSQQYKTIWCDGAKEHPDIKPLLLLLSKRDSYQPHLSTREVSYPMGERTAKVHIREDENHRYNERKA